MFPILQLGPAAIPVAPIVLLLGLFISVELVEHQAARLDLDRPIVSNMLYLALAAGFVGARFSYVVFHPGAFVSDPLSIIAPTAVTLDAFSGLLTAIVAGALYAARYHLPLWRTLDVLTPGIAFLGLSLGIAHLASGDAFGMSARLPWSIYLWDDSRHPTQIYETIAALVILAIWWWVRDKSPFDGFSFLLVVGLFAASVLVLEAFRGDSWLFNGWRVAQLVALGVLALVLVIFHWQSRTASRNNSSGGLPTQNSARDGDV